MRMPDAHRKLKKQLDDFAKQPSAFTIPWFQKLAEGLTTKRMKTDRITVSDDMVPGLRAIIRDTGGISFHVQYTIGKSRPYLKIGDVPGTTVDQARKLARTVLSLAKQGIDPQSGLHERLLRELAEQGDKWRP
jgi:Arm DNA-binding domain